MERENEEFIQFNHNNQQYLTNFAKLGYHQIFYRKEGQLVVEQLGNYEKPYSLKYFHAMRQIHQKGVKKFKTLCCYQESENQKRRRRGYSIDTEAIGAYYLNNWLSHDQYFCEKPNCEDKTSFLIYEILGMRWTRAIELITTFPKNSQISTLEYLLTGFKAISTLLAQQDKGLVDNFLGRSKYSILANYSNETIGNNYKFVNVLEQQGRIQFASINNLSYKIKILNANLDYLVRFASNYQPKTKDPYLKLAFKIIGNKVDQEQGNLSENQDYLKLLLKLDLKLSDRLNFAGKLLGQRRRREFSMQLQQSLCLFPRFDNILYYTVHPTGKSKEEHIQMICKSYLDEYLDLETVAYLAHEFPFLAKYYLQFRQALQFSCEYKELQKLQGYRWGTEKQGFRDNDTRYSFSKSTSFFDLIVPAEERILDWKATGELVPSCEICCKKMLKTEMLLQCGKCRHGGHLTHLLKWFEEYENCPHIGCSCLCN